MVIYFHYVKWGGDSVFGCEEGIGYVYGRAFVRGGVNGVDFNQIGVRVCRVREKVVGRDDL